MAQFIYTMYKVRKAHGDKVILDDVTRQALWIPPGFAHGFCALSEAADVFYKCTEYYDPASERGIPWDDPLIGIHWPVADPVVSDKDRKYPPMMPDSADLPSYTR